MDEIITRLAEDLPVSVQGLTVRDSNGDYNVYLNAKLSREEQQRVYCHELEHIRGGDFDRLDPVSALERDCEARTARDLHGRPDSGKEP